MVEPLKLPKLVRGGAPPRNLPEALPIEQQPLRRIPGGMPVVIVGGELQRDPRNLGRGEHLPRDERPGVARHEIIPHGRSTEVNMPGESGVIPTLLRLQRRIMGDRPGPMGSRPLPGPPRRVQVPPFDEEVTEAANQGQRFADQVIRQVAAMNRQAEAQRQAEENAQRMLQELEARRRRAR